MIGPVSVVTHTDPTKRYLYASMAAPPDGQQPQASTSQQGLANGASAAAASAAGQAGPRKTLKEMSKGQPSAGTPCNRAGIAVDISFYQSTF